MRLYDVIIEGSLGLCSRSMVSICMEAASLSGVMPGMACVSGAMTGCGRGGCWCRSRGGCGVCGRGCRRGVPVAERSLLLLERV